MNYEQFKGAGDRVVSVLVTWAFTWAVAHNYIGQSDATELAPLLIALVAGIIGWTVNRRESIAKSASNLGDVVMTDPKIAEATPERSTIIPLDAKPQEIKEAVADAKEVNRRD